MSTMRALALVAGTAAFGLLVAAVTAPPTDAEAPTPTTTAAPRDPEPLETRKPRPPPKPKPRPKKPYVVAAVGDSLTDYKSHGGKFLRFLEKKCPNSQFDNYGRGGKMVNQMRRKFAGDVLAAGKPGYTHLIVFGGVNDLYSDLTAGRTPTLVAKDLLHMYSKARERQIRVVAVTVAPWGGFKRYYNAKRGAATRKLNEWILDQVDAGTVDYTVDAYSVLSCGNAEVLCPEYAKPFRDGLHFGPKGHEALGRALYERAFKDCA